MRTLTCVALLAAACSVPDKQPLTGDGGTDGGFGDPNGAPDTRITSAPNEFDNSTGATFEFESNRADARFECSVDGAPPAACTSPFTRTLNDGTHSFSVRAITPDGDGDDSPAEHLWLIDTVAPITTLTEAPAALDNSTMVRFSFMSNEMNVGFECALDGASFTQCRSGDEFGPVGDGAHSFSVRAVDRAGNVDASPAIHAWSVDTSTPDTTLLSGPVGASASPTATFSFLSPDAGPGATFQCSLDGSAFATCVSPVEYGGLAMGVHTFAVRVVDANNNIDPTPATRTWSVDLTPPETTITSGPSGTIAMASASIVFTSNEAEVRYECSLDGAAFAECTSPFNATMLAQGAHTFSVRAIDIAGHIDPTPATASWTVDTTTPALAFTDGLANGSITGPRAVFTWTTNEGTVECRFDTEEAWMPCASPFAFNTPPGANSFFLRATDSAGNVTELSRFWESLCLEAEPSGALGALRFYSETGQSIMNYTGGAPAFLGETDQPEAVDPVYTFGRIAEGLEFNAGEGDVVVWPLGGGAAPSFTIELYARPEAAGGTRDVIVSGDGRIAIRVTTVNNDVVRYTATVVATGGVMYTLTSADYPARQWDNLVLSLQEPVLRFWVNGDRVETANARLGSAPSLDTLRIGGNYSGGIDDMRVSTVAETTDEPVLIRYCPSTRDF